MKSIYNLKYTLNKEPQELNVEVQLKMVDGELKRNQNVYYGIVLINGTLRKNYDLHSCVNAKYAAEDIFNKQKEELIEKNKGNKTFKIGKLYEK